jgi:type II secretory pathway pseudopilin PulG
MFDEWIHIGAMLVVIVIVIFVGVIAMPPAWKATDQVVQSSGDTRLQTAYQTGKEMINSAGDLKDGSDLTNAVGNFRK